MSVWYQAPALQNSAPMLPVSTLTALFTVSCATMTSDTVKSENALGKKVFEENCSFCHHYPDDLKDPRDFIARAVHTGGERMPSFASTLNPEEEEAVIDYILSQ